MLPLASRGAPSVPALLRAIDAVAADGWGLLHKAVLSGDILMAQVCSPVFVALFRSLSDCGSSQQPLCVWQPRSGRCCSCKSIASHPLPSACKP